MMAFLHQLTETHEVSDTYFLIDAGGYLATLAHQELSCLLNHSERNQIKSGFRPSRCGSTGFTRSGRGVQPAPSTDCDGLDTIIITIDRNQALDGRTLAEEIIN
jgi:hypothetical protein